MSPDKKAEIARINGAKSHGLTARNLYLATGDTERYQRLPQTHIDRFQPNTTYELNPIGQLASIALAHPPR